MNTITFRAAQNREEVETAQRLDTLEWPDGYKRYQDLYSLDPNSVHVAVNADQEVISYVGVEQISPAHLGKGMPHWDHDPHKWLNLRGGSAWYIVGHAVEKNYRNRNISHGMIDHLIETATFHPDIRHISVMFRLAHPSIFKQFWISHGFEEQEDTLDEKWKAAPDSSDSGGVLFNYNVVKKSPAKASELTILRI